MKFTIFTFLLTTLMVVPSFGQISQEHPELCAKPDGYVALPPNISVVIDRSQGHADLFIGSGNSATRSAFPAW